MAIVRWKKRNYDPWDEMKSLQRSINDLFNLDNYTGTTGLFDGNHSPAVDVVESDSEFTVNCELPGINIEDLDISFAKNVLTLKGSKKDNKEEREGKYYKKEIVSGSFQRTISFPNTVDQEAIEARFKDGILTLRLPKREEAKAKAITVKVD